MTTNSRTPSLRVPAIALAALLVAACAPMQERQAEVAKPAAPPRISEDTLRKRAQDQLAQGIEQYRAGDYDNAVRNLQGSLDHGLLTREEQSRARKFMAFSHCISGRETQCREQFRKAFEIYPDFALTPAEDGHPIWGRVYRDVRTQLITEREAAQAKAAISVRGKAEQLLADGMVKYEAGDYAAAYDLLQAAVKEGLRGRANQVRAMKHSAFSLCLQKKFSQCRDTFIAIYEVDPEFDLSPAEAGHPEWRLTFAGAKRRAQQMLKEREAQAREKSKAPPTASVPQKN